MHETISNHAKESFGKEYRNDRQSPSRGKSECKKGKPCGDYCIPKDSECKESGKGKGGRAAAIAIPTAIGGQQRSALG